MFSDGGRGGLNGKMRWLVCPACITFFLAKPASTARGIYAKATQVMSLLVEMINRKSAILGDNQSIIES